MIDDEDGRSLRQSLNHRPRKFMPTNTISIQSLTSLPQGPAVTNASKSSSLLQRKLASYLAVYQLTWIGSWIRANERSTEL